ncbi:hypothetical protein DL766_001449 [Monosporascus sp. MC13-8B]|uniref:Uncharacterized protein n=1 Tax=Monosporascus cannonballus TaxID=155416 RepID=A0ABY0HEA2_9PEZI|nr:hypothetical protein DL762_003085 [Monosporascus cannonballus]RYP00450.1 hypothetical protein DL763_000802 [Monosporascus cannonballus]RYP37633.1 hypothetical protein DL766_001449 [Monosporascus sp. MC13-8B]
MSSNNNNQQRTYPLRRPQDGSTMPYWPSWLRLPQGHGSGFRGPHIGTGPYPGYDCMGSCTCLCDCRRDIEGWRRACDTCVRGDHRRDDARGKDDVFVGGPPTEWSYGPDNYDDGWWTRPYEKLTWW